MDLYEKLNKIEEGLGDRYLVSLNMAHMAATVADNYAMEADSILRRTKNYVLETKQMFKQLRNLLSKLLKKADNLEGERFNRFNSSVDFIQNLLTAIENKKIDSEQQEKIINFIKTV